MTKETIEVHVRAVDDELEFSVMRSATGKELLNHVVETLNIKESWYFGLRHIDCKKRTVWLELDQKIAKQAVEKDGVLSFELLPRFYPENVEEDIIQDITLKLFYWHVKAEMFNGAVYCPHRTFILLASFAMQAEHGDLSGIAHDTAMKHINRAVPHRVVEQFHGRFAWREHVLTWWSELADMDDECAMLEYLKIAQPLDMFGVSYFAVQNKKRTDLQLGVDAFGLTVCNRPVLPYDRPCINLVEAEIRYPWAQIRKISFNRNAIAIKTIGQRAKDVVLRVAAPGLCASIVSQCAGNHALYIRRRRPLSAQVAVLREQASDRRKHRLQLRSQITEVTHGRELAEKLEHRRRMQLEAMHEQLERSQLQISEAHTAIELLTDQVQSSKDEIEKKRETVLVLSEETRLSEKLNEEERDKLNNIKQEFLFAEFKKQEYVSGGAPGMCGKALKNPEQCSDVVPYDGNKNVLIRESEESLSTSESTTQANSGEETVSRGLGELESSIEKESGSMEVVVVNNKGCDLLRSPPYHGIVQTYSCLRQVRGGSIRRIIDQFENM